MESVVIGYQNRIDESTLSGGSWQAPLSNLKERRLQAKARSSDLVLANTQFDITLEQGRPLGMVVLCAHNFSVDVKVRITLGSSLGTSDILDSGWQEVWPAMYSTLALDWEDPNYWTGKLDEELRQEYPSNYVYIFPYKCNSQYLRVEIDDTTNTAGYVELGRVFVGRAAKQSLNVAYGATLTWKDDSRIGKNRLGSKTYEEVTKYRVANFTYDNATRTEALESLFEVQRLSGTTREVVFVGSDYDFDKGQLVRLAFLGTFTKLDEIQWYALDIHKTSFEIEESV